MDLLKVFDLTVREIKREVNLKVLKVPEIEQKMVLKVLWTRLGETGKDWDMYISKDQNIPSSGSRESATRSKRSETPEKHLYDEDDDFDPRATSKESTSANPQVDLFGEGLIGDLMDAPTSMPSETGSANNNSSTVDLFADATFLSTAPTPKDSRTGGNAQFQPNIDLFASEPASSAMASSTVDFFAVSSQVVQPEAKATDVGVASVNSFDPFAAIPLNNFNDPDPFGAFTSVTDSSSSDPTLNTIQRGKVNDMNSIKSSPEAKTTPKNDSFQPRRPL